LISSLKKIVTASLLLFFQLNYNSVERKNPGLNQYFENLKNLEFELAKVELKKNENSVEFELLALQLIKVLEDNGQSNINEIIDADLLDKKYNSKLQKSLRALILGYNFLFYNQNRVQAFVHFKEALELSESIDSRSMYKFILLSIMRFYEEGIFQSNDEFMPYLEDFYNISKTPEDYMLYYSYKFNLIAQKEPYIKDRFQHQELFDSIFEKMDSVVRKMNHKNKLLVYYYFDKGNFSIKSNALKGKEYFDRSFELTTDSIFYKPIRFNLFMALARVNERLNKYREAISTVNKATPYINKNNLENDSYTMYAYKGDYFSILRDYDSAYFAADTVRKLNDRLETQKHNREVSMMSLQLNDAQKEKEMLKLKNWLLIMLIVFGLGGVINYLTVKNSRKKRLFAIQEKELEKQKNLTLIKEQEITTINAMIEGQEKERKRVAEDLHDNLGSVIATLKLHFDNLKLNRRKEKVNQKSLFDKTENLIDEAYQKVRSIAHAKNAGVIANQGLLIAVKLMAEKISSAHTIQIDVIDYGLEKPIENSLEISLFRMIQELTTNIIKHAKANHATINISQDIDDITILIEDNGRGMDTSELKFNKGMGLYSIEKKVSYLKGSFTVDSSKDKGTTIIINLPN